MNIVYLFSADASNGKCENRTYMKKNRNCKD